MYTDFVNILAAFLLPKRSQNLPGSPKIGCLPCPWCPSGGCFQGSLGPGEIDGNTMPQALIDSPWIAGIRFSGCLLLLLSTMFEPC